MSAAGPGRVRKRLPRPSTSLRRDSRRNAWTCQGCWPSSSYSALAFCDAMLRLDRRDEPISEAIRNARMMLRGAMHGLAGSEPDREEAAKILAGVDDRLAEIAVKLCGY